VCANGTYKFNPPLVHRVLGRPARATGAAPSQGTKSAARENLNLKTVCHPESFFAVQQGFYGGKGKRTTIWKRDTKKYLLLC